MKVAPLGYDAQEVQAALAPLRHPFRVAVERAKNPFNIGSIIRTAHSFLAQEIVLIGTEPWYERAAMGMQRYEKVREFETAEAFVANASAAGWPLVVFEKDIAETDLWRCPLPTDAVLVFGNEDHGVSSVLAEAAVTRVAIPMFGVNHSYPISVAAGIAMAEWARRHSALAPTDIACRGATNR